MNSLLFRSLNACPCAAVKHSMFSRSRADWRQAALQETEARLASPGLLSWASGSFWMAVFLGMLPAAKSESGRKTAWTFEMECVSFLARGQRGEEWRGGERQGGHCECPQPLFSFACRGQCCAVAGLATIGNAGISSEQWFKPYYSASRSASCFRTSTWESSSC